LYIKYIQSVKITGFDGIFEGKGNKFLLKLSQVNGKKTEICTLLRLRMVMCTRARFKVMARTVDSVVC
jgi:hypothetical protein